RSPNGSVFGSTLAAVGDPLSSSVRVVANSRDARRLCSTLGPMPHIVTCHVIAFFLYDAAEVIDLAAVATLIGGTSRVRLTPKTATPAYVQYEQPPVTIDSA